MVKRLIVLDTGPIGLVTNPKLSSQGVACNQWLQSHLKLGNRIIVTVSHTEVVQTSCDCRTEKRDRCLGRVERARRSPDRAVGIAV